MSVILSLFNHKGGVSKTTTTFNLGWALADAGYNVLVIDGDPQCNLTGTALGYAGYEDLVDFYANNADGNIATSLDPVFSGNFTGLRPAAIYPTGNEKMWLLPGSIKFAENETQISVALSTRQSIPALANLPGSLRKLIQITCTEHNIDIAIIDMSPSVGAINQCFLMGSDYFIVPTSPDFYCNQAIYSLSDVIPRWNSDVDFFRSNAEYKFDDPPKFIGIISQKYRPRNGQPARSFQDWIDRIKDTVNRKLIPTLNSINMTVSLNDFVESGASDTPYNLANISDFNSLIAKSQEHNTPVFALTDEQIDQTGTVLESMQKNRDSFKRGFEELAKTVAKLTGLA